MSHQVYIQLDQFLKLTNVVGTGGQAKRLIQGGEVMLNGEVETRRKKKLYSGDVVEVFDQVLVVEYDEDDEEDEDEDDVESLAGE